jgi:hypothetical protein
MDALEVKGNKAAVMWIPTSAEYRLLEMAKKGAQAVSRGSAVLTRRFPKMQSITLNIAELSQYTSWKAFKQSRCCTPRQYT